MAAYTKYGDNFNINEGSLTVDFNLEVV
jgi:hypothetical protein